LTNDKDFGEQVSRHGDGVKDISFTVTNLRSIYDRAVNEGAEVVQEPLLLQDENGSVLIATLKTFGDTTHTLVERIDFKGAFLPGFKPHYLKEPFNQLLEAPKLSLIDHCGGNQPENGMDPVLRWYEKMF
jgi:4-hydroxyphenylpyruvate dioxygenase